MKDNQTTLLKRQTVGRTESGKEAWTDVTWSIENDMVNWPHQPQVKVQRLHEMDGESDANVSCISMSVHTGTHMDAPIHFIRNGKDITEFPLDLAHCDVRVISVTNTDAVTFADLKISGLNRGENIILKTDNSNVEWIHKPFIEDYVHLTPEAADFLVSLDIRFVGIDYLSIGKGRTNAGVHKTLLNNGVWIMEGLDLRYIESGAYEMICLPLKIKGADAAPARVLLRQT